MLLYQNKNNILIEVNSVMKLTKLSHIQFNSNQQIKINIINLINHLFILFHNIKLSNIQMSQINQINRQNQI
jgi:hypothetical protein